MTYTAANGKTFPVLERDGRFYYWSPKAGRLIRIPAAKVTK